MFLMGEPFSGDSETLFENPFIAPDVVDEPNVRYSRLLYWKPYTTYMIHPVKDIK